MRKTTDINTFFVPIVLIFEEGIGLNIVLDADLVLGLHAGALDRLSLSEFFAHEPNMLGPIA